MTDPAIPDRGPLSPEEPQRWAYVHSWSWPDVGHHRLVKAEYKGACVFDRDAPEYVSVADHEAIVAALRVQLAQVEQQLEALRKGEAELRHRVALRAEAAEAENERLRAEGEQLRATIGAQPDWTHEAVVALAGVLGNNILAASVGGRQNDASR